MKQENPGSRKNSLIKYVNTCTKSYRKYLLVLLYLYLSFSMEIAKPSPLTTVVSERKKYMKCIALKSKLKFTIRQLGFRELSNRYLFLEYGLTSPNLIFKRVCNSDFIKVVSFTAYSSVSITTPDAFNFLASSIKS